MFLYNQDETCLTLNKGFCQKKFYSSEREEERETYVHMYQATIPKIDFENFGFRNGIGRKRDDAPALLVLAVAFNVKDPVETLFGNVDFDLNSVR